MDILLTGATGFIGQSLIPYLLNHSHRVFAWVRNPAKMEQLFGQHALAEKQLVFSTELEPFRSLCFDAVINLAGEPIVEQRWTHRRKQVLFDSRIGTTEALVNFLASQSQPPRLFISSSAIGYYGAQGSNVLTEASSPVDEFQHQLCRHWEAAACKARALGCRVCLLRTGLVVGPQGGFLSKMLPLFKLGIGGKLGSGSQYMSWIHMDDWLAILNLLFENTSIEGPINLTAPEPVTNKVFSKTLGRVLNRPAIIPTPGIALNIMLGEMACLLLTGQRVIPQKAVDAGFTFSYPTLESALQNVLK